MRRTILPFRVWGPILLAPVFLILFTSLARAGSVPLALPSVYTVTIDSDEGVTGHSCGSVGTHITSGGWSKDGNYFSVTAYAETNCSTGGRGSGAKSFYGAQTLTWDVSGALVSAAEVQYPADNIPTQPGCAANPAYYNVLTCLDAEGNLQSSFRGVYYPNIPPVPQGQRPPFVNPVNPQIEVTFYHYTNLSDVLTLETP